MGLNSQRVRALTPENNPLKVGIGWKVEDLDKPQIMVESTFDDSHPGSVHLDRLVNEAMRGIADTGRKEARHSTTDICDGITQGHDGINYPLAHRDMTTSMIGIHGNSTGFDGGMFIISCDKSVPACLMGLARLDMPSIVVTGGVMDAGPDLLVLEQIGAYSTMCQRSEITEEKLTYYKHNAYSSCGACSFMGTTSTMQIMAESLGLILPGSALVPVTYADLREMAYKAGLQVVELAGRGLKVDDIVTMKSFENVIMVRAAISDSTNSLLYIPAITHELGLGIGADTFNRMHKGAHYLLDIRPAGKRPAQPFYYAGGIPAVMEGIKSMLHLDVITVTGKTSGENLEGLKASGSCDKRDGYLEKQGLRHTDVTRTFEKSIGTDGTVTMLRGNLAPKGSVVKHSVIPREMFKAILKARPFDCKEDAIGAIISKKMQPEDAVFIRYEGPKGSEVPEMFYTTEAIFPDPELGRTIALITDGRFSRASRGSTIGHVSPETAGGGPITLVEEDDLIRIDIPEHVPEIMGVKGKELPGEEVERILTERGKVQKPKEAKYKKGVLKIYSEHAVSPMKGGHMI